MKLKRLGMALVVVLALGAVMASSALAAATTTDVKWYTGASPGTALKEKEGEKPAETEAVSSTGSGELISEVGTTALKLKATEIECVECKIENSGGSAVGSGKLNFKKVTVVAPSTCAVEGVSGGSAEKLETVETLALKIKADYMIESKDYVLFEPSGTEFAKFKLVKGSGSCPISGTYSVTGSDFVKTNNATGTFAKSQGVTASGAINAEAGGQLKLGAKNAELNGTASFSLTSGKEFATK